MEKRFLLNVNTVVTRKRIAFIFALSWDEIKNGVRWVTLIINWLLFRIIRSEVSILQNTSLHFEMGNNFYKASKVVVRLSAIGKTKVVSKGLDMITWRIIYKCIYRFICLNYAVLLDNETAFKTTASLSGSRDLFWDSMWSKIFLRLDRKNPLTPSSHKMCSTWQWD